MRGVMGNQWNQAPKALIVGLCLAVVASVIPAAPAAASRAAIVIDARSGAVVYQKSADLRRHPASLTKMMTLYLIFEALDEGRLTLDAKFRVSARAAARPASKLGLRKGTSITARDAIGALISKSANDVATVVAEALGGEEWFFAQMMTRKARALGMRKTNFRNASGLYHRSQLTSARDMATLARALVRDFPQRYRLFAARSFRYGGKTYRNHNRMLKTHAGVDGIKTGYIRASGFNLVASAMRGDRRMIAVVLGARSPKLRDRETAALIARAFAQTRMTGPPPPPPPQKPLNLQMAQKAQKAEKAQKTQNQNPIIVAGAPWAIQVGAYSRAKGAYAALEKSRPYIPGIVARAKAVVVPVELGDGGLYRARFVGVSASEARRACRILTRKRLDCDAVRHVTYGAAPAAPD